MAANLFRPVRPSTFVINRLVIVFCLYAALFVVVSYVCVCDNFLKYLIYTFFYYCIKNYRFCFLRYAATLFILRRDHYIFKQNNLLILKAEKNVNLLYHYALLGLLYSETYYSAYGDGDTIPLSLNAK